MEEANLEQAKRQFAAEENWWPSSSDDSSGAHSSSDDPSDSEDLWSTSRAKNDTSKQVKCSRAQFFTIKF